LARKKYKYVWKIGYEHKDNGEWNKFEDVLGNLKRFINAGKIRE
jgi:hypothetical protein